MQAKEDEDAKSGSKQGWNIGKLTDEASLAGDDQIRRQALRGDETKGDADERDIGGSVDTKDTPHGREWTKRRNDEGGPSNG